MNDVVVGAVGTLAAVATTLCWVPQAIRTIRTRDTRGISIWMQVMLNIGIALWLAYGIMLGSWPLICANFVTQLLTATILMLKIRYG